MIVWLFLLSMMSLNISVNLQFIKCPNRRGIYFATSQDCIFYYSCANGFFKVQACFPWQKFDIHTLRCRSRFEVDCNPEYAGIWRPQFGGTPSLQGGESETIGEPLDQITEENNSEEGIGNTELAEGKPPVDQEIPEETNISGQEEAGIVEEGGEPENQVSEANFSEEGTENGEPAEERPLLGQELPDEIDSTGQEEEGNPEAVSEEPENEDSTGKAEGSLAVSQETPEETDVTGQEEVGSVEESSEEGSETEKEVSGENPSEKDAETSKLAERGVVLGKELTGQDEDIREPDDEDSGENVLGEGTENSELVEEKPIRQELPEETEETGQEEVGRVEEGDVQENKDAEENASEEGTGDGKLSEGNPLLGKESSKETDVKTLEKVKEEISEERGEPEKKDTGGNSLEETSQDKEKNGESPLHRKEITDETGVKGQEEDKTVEGSSVKEGEHLLEVVGENPSEKDVGRGVEDSNGQETPTELENTGQDGGKSGESYLTENLLDAGLASENPESKSAVVEHSAQKLQEQDANEENSMESKSAMEIQDSNSVKQEIPALVESSLDEPGEQKSAESQTNPVEEKATISEISEESLDKNSENNSNSGLGDESLDIKDRKNVHTEQRPFEEMLIENGSTKNASSIDGSGNLETQDKSKSEGSTTKPLSLTETQEKYANLTDDNIDSRNISQTEEILLKENENIENKGSTKVKEMIGNKHSGPPAAIDNSLIEFQENRPTSEEGDRGNSLAGERGTEIQSTTVEKNVTPEEKIDIEEIISSATEFPKNEIPLDNSMESRNSETALGPITNLNVKDPLERKKLQEISSITDKRSTEKVSCNENPNLSNENETPISSPITSSSQSSGGESSFQDTNSVLQLQDTTVPPGKIWYWCGSGRFVLASNTEEGDTICLQLQDPESPNQEGNGQAEGEWVGHTFLDSNDTFA